MKDNQTKRVLNIALSLFVLLAMTAFLFAQIAKFEAYAIEGKEEAIAVEEVQGEETIKPTMPLDESEVLLEDFIEIITEEYAKELDTVSFEAKDGIVPSRLRGARLTGAEKKAYDLLKENIEAIAKGENEGGSTVVDLTFGEIYSDDVLSARYSASDLGVGQVVANGDISDEAKDAVSEKYSFDVEKVINALIYDCPYTLFWYDKTVGLSTVQYTSVEAKHNGVEYRAYCTPNSFCRFYFAVSMDYCPNSYYVHIFNGTNAPIQTDTEKIKSLTTAVDNAMSVVTAASGKGTYDKLDYYRDWICQKVTYDAAAANKNNNTPYGKPWQLINAFDDDPNNNSIVCEGYSKAFKYLCDLTDNLDADCRIVTGVMAGGTGEGAHMWNVVEVGGKNYLVDVTNCDAGTIGAPRALFMVGAPETSENSDAYNFRIGSQDITFSYDDETKGIYTREERLLATANYDPKLEPKPELIEITPTLTLSATSYVYNGKVKTPGVTVKYNGEVLKDGTDYKVTYASGRKDVGTYKVTVTMINNYRGSKATSFTINPKAATIAKPAAAKKAITAKWSKQTAKMSKKQITGYQVQVSPVKTFKSGVKSKKVAGAKKTSYKFTRLKSKTKYYVRVRTYMKIGKTTYYSGWSKLKTIKAK